MNLFYKISFGVIDIKDDASTSPSMLPVRKPPTTAEKKNPLLSDAAQSVLAMGYLPRIVKVAVDKVLGSKGKLYVHCLCTSYH